MPRHGRPLTFRRLKLRLLQVGALLSCPGVAGEQTVIPTCSKLLPQFLGADGLAEAAAIAAAIPAGNEEGRKNLSSALGCTARSGDLHGLYSMLDAGGWEVVDVPGHSGWRALHEAAMNGHVTATELLLAAKASIDPQEQDLRTPLHWAVLSGKTGVVELLVASKADLEARDMSDATPIHGVTVHGNVQMLDLLVAAGADVFSADSWQQNLLHNAVSEGHPKMVQRLLEYGVPFDRPDFDSTTALQRAVTAAQAALRGSGTVLNLLLNFAEGEAAGQ